MPDAENRYRSYSQYAPGARSRGMVQNAAITGALAPSGANTQAFEKPAQGARGGGGPVTLGTAPDVSRPMRVTDTPPAPLGSPTPGQAPRSSLMQNLGALVGGMRDQDMKPGLVSPQGGYQPGRGSQIAPNRDPSARFLEIARRYTPNRTGRDQLLADPDFQAAFPGARLHKNDWLHLGDGIGLIDSILSFDEAANTGQGWQYLTEADAIANAEQGNLTKPLRGGGPSRTSMLLMQLLQNNGRGLL